MAIEPDEELYKLRREAHRVFDPIWEQGIMRRPVAYTWLQVRMGVRPWKAHIGKFNKEECRAVIKICTEFMQDRTK